MKQKLTLAQLKKQNSYIKNKVFDMRKALLEASKHLMEYSKFQQRAAREESFLQKELFQKGIRIAELEMELKNVRNQEICPMCSGKHNKSITCADFWKAKFEALQEETKTNDWDAMP